MPHRRSSRWLPLWPLICLAGPAAAEPAPSVMTDIPPVASLVQAVLGEAGQPGVIVAPGTSPHANAMRPSKARRLEAADIVFWVGPALTPWLTRPIDTLARGAVSVPLLAAPETTRRGPPTPGDATSAAATAPEAEAAEDEAGHGHGHDHGHGHRGDHAHDEHAHGDHAHEDHAHGHGDDHGHNHGAGVLDPHAWLDPANGRAWLGVIADTLAVADPARAEQYRANAAEARDQLQALEDRMAEEFASRPRADYLVTHDAYGYFEERFGQRHLGAITDLASREPGAKRLRELRARLAGEEIACVIAEPGYRPGLVKAVLGETPVEVVVVDPLGAGLEPGPGLYGALLDELAAAIADCGPPPA